LGDVGRGDVQPVKVGWASTGVAAGGVVDGAPFPPGGVVVGGVVDGGSAS
jgi:hypothetical protein